VRAGPLSGLPRLRSLDLRNVLDVASWDEDARHVALLTGLSKISSDLRYRVHRGFCQNHWGTLGPPWMPYLQKRWVLLHPLVPLWQVKSWMYIKCICSTSTIWSRFLCEASEDLRHVMGLPRRQLNLLAALGDPRVTDEEY
jgi:hypothetical protein